MNDQEFDLVVVGTGIAGGSAAAAAVQSGLSVAIVERASEADYGGNTRYTEANFRMKNENEVSDDFEEQFSENSGSNPDPNVLAALSGEPDFWPPYVKAHPHTDPHLIATLAAEAGPTIQWLKSLGVTFNQHKLNHYIIETAPRIRPNGGGLALIETLSNYARKNGARIFFNHTAYRLIVSEKGRIAGVLARTADGDSCEIHGRGVVLASGGFEGNPEMLAQYVGKRAEFIRPVAKGGYYNKGEGIRMALDIGAASAGDFASFHAEPIDPRAKKPAPLMNYPYGLLVNADGRRFTDEAPGPTDHHYDVTSRAIAEQPNGIVHVITDSSVTDVPNYRGIIRTDQPAINADTLDELADKIGVPALALRKTVDDYNAACVKGEFKPLEPDGLATVGLYPPKSNWARPLQRGPWEAYPIYCANTFTFGGLKVNTKAQVLDTDGRPITGLYAAGETMGLYHQGYRGGTSVMRGAVFGRIAGIAHGELLQKSNSSSGAKAMATR
jgi:tricarballylate dehydrogenase